MQFGATQSNWGQPLENKSGFTTPNFINAQYFVFGNQTGGYSPAGGTCSFYLPAGDADRGFALRLRPDAGAHAGNAGFGHAVLGNIHGYECYLSGRVCHSAVE